MQDESDAIVGIPLPSENLPEVLVGLILIILGHSIYLFFYLFIYLFILENIIWIVCGLS